jgi:hypothetical protein
MAAVDRVVATRLPQVEAIVDKLRASQPGATSDELAELVIKKYSRELAAAGAASGAVAAAPAVGTAASLATTVADIGVAFARLAEMVIGVGLAYGHDLSDLDARSDAVYQVLGGATGAMTDGEKSAGKMKKQLGKTVLATKSPAATTAKVTEIMGTKVLTRLVARKSAVKLASLLPLGIGAGVGAAGNRALANGVGRTAREFFGRSGPGGRRVITTTAR